MKLGCPRLPALVYLLYPSLKKYRPFFDFLDLRSTEVSMLYVVFQRVPSKHKNHEFIEIKDLMDFFNIGENRFMIKAFSVLCKKKRTYINFRDFVVLIWFFCTIENNLALFVFSVYDTDGNGLLDPEEANVMNQDIYGKYYARSKEGQRLNAKMQELGKGGVARLFFKEFCRGKNSNLLKPAVNNINSIIKHTLGKTRWTRMSEYRKRLTRDRFMDVFEVIAMMQQECGDMSDSFNIDHIMQKRESSKKRRFIKAYTASSIKSFEATEAEEAGDSESVVSASTSTTRLSKKKSSRVLPINNTPED